MLLAEGKESTIITVSENNSSGISSNYYSGSDGCIKRTTQVL